MRFGERMGLSDSSFLQVNSINIKLRNRMLNLLIEYFNKLSYDKKDILNDLVDYCGLETSYETANIDSIRKVIINRNNAFEWYLPYEIVERFFTILNKYLEDCGGYSDFEHYSSIKTSFIKRLQEILVEEKSGYRLLDEKFILITNEQELETINESIKTPYDSVNQHMQKAIEAFSSKTNPDYEGTIKNAISAVESMCSIIVGKNTTLNKALNKLEKNGVKIHPTLKEAFIKLYAYTCDETGIRHGGIDFQNAPQEDAKYMLITCSAFINYLVEKI